MRCPECGSKKTTCTNKLWRYASFVISIIIGGIPALLFSALGGNNAAGAKIARDIRRSLCDHADYKCNDCGHEFSESLL